MKRQTLLLLFAGLAVLGQSDLWAQKLTVAETRRFNLDALRTLEDYEKSSALSTTKRRDQEDFKYLFKDTQLPIFNDLNGLSADSTLTVSDYASLLCEKANSTSVKIKNLRKGEPYFSEGAWKMDVSFDKEISYFNGCEAIFNSRTDFGEDFHLEGTLAWNSEYRDCQFLRLEGTPVELLPSDYLIYKDHRAAEPRDTSLLVNGKHLEYNDWKQAFLPWDSKFVYPDPDVRISVDTIGQDCHLVEVKYKPKRWRIKALYQMSLGNPYDVSALEDAKGSTTELGLEMGYIIPSRSKVKWGLFFGAALSQTSLDMTQGKLSYHYNTFGDADIDGDSYTRYYDIRNMRQTLKTTDVAGLAYLDMDIRFSKYFSWYFDLGAKAYYNLSSELSGLQGTYSTYGEYPDYNLVLRPEDNWSNPINGFVKNASWRDDMVEKEDLNPLSVDIMGRVGFRILLYKNLFLDIAGSYQYTVMSPLTMNSYSKVELTGSELNAAIAPMTYTIYGGEKVRPLYESLSTFNRRFLSVNAGLMLRF